MKISVPYRLAFCVAAAALVLLSLTTISLPCDEDCEVEAPTCECACVCHGIDVAVAPENYVLFGVNIVRYAGQLESSLRTFLLSADIFRPPIV